MRNQTQPRTAIVTCRVSPSELAEWRAKAARAGVPVSDLLRRAMARTRTWTAEDSAAARDLARQVARIGVNLNQLARWANTHRSAADALAVLTRLHEIERALAEVRPPSPTKR